MSAGDRLPAGRVSHMATPGTSPFLPEPLSPPAFQAPTLLIFLVYLADSRDHFTVITGCVRNAFGCR